MAVHTSLRQVARCVALIGVAASLAALPAPSSAGSGGETDARPAPENPRPAPARLDLNSATVEQLRALPRIGPAIARRIVDHREAAGGFRSVDELLHVRGIGERTLEVLRPHVMVRRDAESESASSSVGGAGVGGAETSNGDSRS